MQPYARSVQDFVSHKRRQIAPYSASIPDITERDSRHIAELTTSADSGGDLRQSSTAYPPLDSDHEILFRSPRAPPLQPAQIVRQYRTSRSSAHYYSTGHCTALTTVVPDTA
eukprot:3011800-Rhodomonas_salina.1